MQEQKFEKIFYLSQRVFIYLKEIDWDNIKIITPLNQIKILERNLFEDEIEGTKSELIEKSLITESQYTVYCDYIKHRETDNFKKDSDGTIGQRDSASSDSQNNRKTEGKSMTNIEIDDDVYAYLQSKAIPFQEKNPNDVIRRLFGLDKKISLRTVPKPANHKPHDSKAPKADILKLVEFGKLKEGQILFLSYKSQNLSQKYEAKILVNIRGSHFVY